MRIYDRAGFPNPIRIRVVVAAKHLESQIEWVPVDLIGAEHKQPPFLAKNPSGVVPVLELDDGTFITESTAITEYLDNLDGNPILTGRTALEKALVHMMAAARRSLCDRSRRHLFSLRHSWLGHQIARV
jgi:glutathione S-transferase